MAGAPTDYTDELAELICSDIATSTKSLKTICEDSGYPDPATIYRWLHKYKPFCEMYTRARQDQAQLMAEQIIEIADTTEVGEVVTVTPRGTETRTGDMTDHRRLRIDARKWVASKLLPMKYGDSRDTGTRASQDRLEELVEAMKQGAIPRGQVNADANS